MKQYGRKIRSITVIGRKWFDKVNGNTYNNAQILVNGRTVGNTGYQYGYEDFYTQAAGQWLDEHKYIKLERYQHGSTEMLWRYCERNGIAYESMSFYCNKNELTGRN